MKKKTPDNGGFTLIEIIVSIIVISFLSLIAGRGMVEMAKEYRLSMENARVAQQGQIVAARIKKEFSSIRSITCGGANIITYTIQRSIPEGPDVSSIYLTGSNSPILYLKTASDCTGCTSSCAGGDKLAEDVNDFTLSYCKTIADADCSATFPNSPNLTPATVSLVKVILKLKGYGDTPTTRAVISIADPDVVFFGLESGS